MSPRKQNRNEFKDFKETAVRVKILEKVESQDIDKNGRHWIGFISIGDKLVTKVTIPNDHPHQDMTDETKKNIANELKLEPFQFNNLIDCPLSSRKYYKILKKYK